MIIENRKYKVADYVKIPLKIAPIHVICMILLRFFVAVLPSLLAMATSSFVDTAIDIFQMVKCLEFTRHYLKLYTLSDFPGFLQRY